MADVRWISEKANCWLWSHEPPAKENGRRVLVIDYPEGADDARVLLSAALEAMGVPSVLEVWVAPWGNDDSMGTERLPVRTLKEAYRRLPDGGTVRLHAGTYPTREPSPKGVAIRGAGTDEAKDG